VRGCRFNSRWRQSFFS